MEKNEQISAKLKVKNDVVFKELFSKKGNEEFLIEFLSELLKINIQKIEIQKEANLVKSYVQNKLGAIDIKATLNDSTMVDIEMQIGNEPNIIPRTTFYSSKLISLQLNESEQYNKLKPVIIIAILNFNCFKYEEYINKTVMVLDKHRDDEVNKYQIYYYIELPKFRQKELELGNKISEWLTFIDDENKKRVEEVMQNNKLVKRAEEEYKYLVGDEEIRRIAELREKAMLDRNSELADARESGFNEGRKEGIEEGVKKGSEKTQRDTVKAMLENGLDTKLICKITKLSPQKVNEIKKQLDIK